MADTTLPLDRAAFEGPEADDAFTALSDAQSRYVLRYLYRHPTATLDQLADVVTGAQAAATDTIATADDRERARVTLYHVALPKLDALGYVDFDAEDRTVTRAEIPQTVVSLLGITG